MADDRTPSLRVLIVNEEPERVDRLTAVMTKLGHEVVMGDSEHPDIALVGLASDSEHALELISEFVREAACPVIAVLPGHNPEFVSAAADRGVFAYIVEGEGDGGELDSTVTISLSRFAEYQNLQGAFERRASIEQAKGILMARHGVDESKAFALLRNHARRGGRKLTDIAEAVVQSHALLLEPLEEGPPTEL